MLRSAHGVTHLFLLLLMLGHNLLLIVAHPSTGDRRSNRPRLQIQTEQSALKEVCGEDLPYRTNNSQEKKDSSHDQQHSSSSNGKENTSSRFGSSTNSGDLTVRQSEGAKFHDQQFSNKRHLQQSLTGSNIFKLSRGKLENDAEINSPDNNKNREDKVVENQLYVKPESQSTETSKRSGRFLPSKRSGRSLPSKRLGRSRRWTDEISRVLARQVDPVHSCIEAKCAGAGGHNYMDCIFRQCIASRHGRYIKKRHLSANQQSSAFPEFLPKYDGGVVHNVDKSQISNGAGRLAGSYGKDGKMMVTGFTGIRDDGGDGSVEKRVEKLLEVRRAFNDITDLCVKHDCGPAEHTVQYFRCKHQCTLKRP